MTTTTTAAKVDWNALASGSVLPASAIADAIDRAKGDADIPFTQDVRYFDFESYGKPFTQVALVLEPERALRVNGRRVVLVTSEGGSDNGRTFIRDNAGKEGLGPWLARRGVTFIQLCRIGRWNLLSSDPLGSWRDVPLGGRMPVFHRRQERHWSADDYVTVAADGVSSPTGSQSCRTPRAGCDLEGYMLALLPVTQMRGFDLAIRALVAMDKRDDVLLLYYGFSTGGAYLWPLAKQLPPDGIAGYGMSNFPVTYFSSRSAKGNYEWLYDRSAARLRERGTKDFEFFNRDLGEVQRAELWQQALHAPRFKSFEDTFMFYNVAALSESSARLWNAPFLPAADRERGFPTLLRENLDLCFPDEKLASIRVLDLYGTRDEVLTPDVARAVLTTVGPYCRKYRMAFLDGYHHSISSDHVEAFGSLWLDAIRAGYFSPG
jgi:pimeloyl-ACP methyl ester carboxylesterase